MNDLVIWLRALEEFESHRFLGYTRSQFTILTSASHYWTPDLYISQDSLTQVAARLHPKAGKYLTPTGDRSETGVPGYALASFYKPHRSQFHYSSLDHMRKSAVPILEMGSNHYLILGRSIDGTTGNLSKLWSGKCLHDPSTAYCRARGFSLSLWIKLLSVSKDRSRFILSTGDSGMGIGECSIGRGVSIITDKQSLGASVSHQYTDWMLLQDSSSFEEVGEVAYFSRFLEPKEYNKMVGLLRISELRNFEGQIWTGADLVDSPIDHLASAAAANHSRPGPVYSHGKPSQVSLLQDPEILELQGGGGLRLNIPQRWQCKTNKIFCLEGFSVGGWLRLTFPTNQTYRNTSKSIILFTGNRGKFGIAFSRNRSSITGWYAAGINSNEWYCELSCLELSESTINRQWIHYALVWSTDSELKDSIFSLYVNGRLRGRCGQLNALNGSAYSIPDKLMFATAATLYEDTGTTSTNQLIISAQSLDDPDVRLSVAMVTFQPKALKSVQIAKLIGIDYHELLMLRNSTFYWTVSGLIRHLSPKRLISVRAISQPDQFGTPKGAKCTEGNIDSYIVLTGDTVDKNGESNLKQSCIVDSTRCLSYTFFITFKLLNTTFQDMSPTEIFRSTPFDAPADRVGLRVTIQIDQLFVEVRQNLATLTNTVPIANVGEINTWISLKLHIHVGPTEIFRSTPFNTPADRVGLRVTIEFDQLFVKIRKNMVTLTNTAPIADLGEVNAWISLKLHINGEGIHITVNDNVLSEASKTTSKSEVNFARSSDENFNLRLYVGRGVAMCISDISTADNYDHTTSVIVEDKQDFPCYSDADFLLQLHGTEVNHVGELNSATAIRTFVSGYPADYSSCLSQPEQCKHGALTLSFWTRLDEFTDRNDTPILPKPSQYENLRQVSARSRWTNKPQELHRILHIALRLLDYMYASNQTQNSSVTEIMRYALVILQQWSVTIERAHRNPTYEFREYVQRKGGCVMRLLIRLSAHLANGGQHSKVIFLSRLTTTVRRVTQTVCKPMERPYDGRKSLESRIPAGSFKVVTRSHNSILYEEHLQLSGSAVHTNVTESEMNLSISACFGLLTVQPVEWMQETMASIVKNQKPFCRNLKRRKRSLPAKKPEEIADKFKRESVVHFLIQSFLDYSETWHSTVNNTIKLTLLFNRRQEFEQAFYYRTTGRMLWNVPNPDDLKPCNVAHPVRCAYCDTQDSNTANWNTVGCDSIKSNQTHIECVCPIRDVYTALSDTVDANVYNISYWTLFGMQDERRHSVVTRTVVLNTNAISLLCSFALLGITMFKLVRSRFRIIPLLHFILCSSFAFLHGAMLAQLFVTRSRVGCQVVSMCLYVAGITTTSWLCCEIVATFQILILGNARMKVKCNLMFGLFIPTVMIAVPSSVVDRDAFGGDLLCLPAHESFLFHIFVSTMAAVVLIGLIIRLLVECNVDTPAYMEPLIEKLL
ncbi:hypothetical protein EG68_10346 [Paragonimus skrjabini miyazakii]|uniref:G-protein coupled receptors family 2 profile 2 domain-containing protein n=1 Tax=Paragonimus skrjabini miyazakii TaxID=59628 RepID=A0A8S9YT66_9TREM|nr:hypothetical protein EG68_10346 [Paragonimus skrjabini miyazakii]